MARKKRKREDEDLETVAQDGDAGEELTTTGSLAQMAGLSADHPLLNFYVEDKAKNFIDKFEPCNERDPLAVRFTEAKLRSYFKGYVCPAGDPMKIYMLRLRLAGFYLDTDITGEMVMMVKERYFQRGDTSWMGEMEKS